MTNLLNVLKEMQQNSNGVKNDVINYLLEYSDNDEDLQTHIEDLKNYGCESGQVNHLIYYSDTVEYFEEHENEIMEMLEQFGIEDVESWDGLEELSNIFPRLETPDERHENAENEIMAKAHNETPELYEDDWDEMEEDEQMEAINDYAENIAMYEVDPMELNNQDKNYLAWAIFEQNAHELYNELDEMGLIKVM